ncbi:MAG: radical SAM family heme chaperone HemW [Syntrophomonadaceae bacterium]|nr:radical SAM family heme chaperone HemW [Syntrophomonadaceae bacterium]
MASKDKRKMGMYIHVPFCIKKCGYCDFFSVPMVSSDMLERYTACAVAEIKQQRAELPDVEIATIYIGGGTPSLLTGSQLEQIIQSVQQEFMVKGDVEITIEANPATLDKTKILDIINAGVNRISLGVQSFSDDDLKVLTRIHSARKALDVIEFMHASRLKNFNIDLIYGVPGQSIDRWMESLKTAVECKPEHISTYLLQLEDNTPMGTSVASGKVFLLNEDTEYLMYNRTIDFLRENGFEHYEISNFCRPGFACRHNLIYWQAEEYIGIGPGAVSFVNRCRFVNEPLIKEYLVSIEAGRERPIKVLEKMSRADLASDAIILGLRLCQGIDLEHFKNRFNIDIIKQYGRNIAPCLERGLLECENGHLKLTKEGYFLSNEVLCRFIT